MSDKVDIKDKLRRISDELENVGMTREDIELTNKDISEYMKQEAYVQAECYRILKNAVSRVQYDKTKASIEAIIPQVPILTRRGKPPKKVDLVIYSRSYGTRHVLLTIECKKRFLATTGKSYASATRQVWNYSQKLRGQFCAVYDGWYFFLFKHQHPYMIGVYNPEIGKTFDETFAMNLMTGLFEMEFENKSNVLTQLPRLHDPTFMKARIFPPIAKSIATLAYSNMKDEKTGKDQVAEEGRKLLDNWSRLI